MKKLRFLTAFVAFATMLGLTSCSDDPTELLNGGQGPAGSTILNVNYTVPGDSTKVFVATSVNATASGDYVTIEAENEGTGESLVIEFGNQLNKNDGFGEGTITYTDASGNGYTATSPFTSLNTGVVKLSESPAGTITGAFSFIGYDNNATVPSDGVPFFSGVFEQVPLSGTLPTPLPYEPPFQSSIKATIDATTVDFATAYTSVNQQGTSFIGANAEPEYEISLFLTDVSEGTFAIDMQTVKASVTVGEDTYIAIGGEIIITDITDGVATGTFSFTGEHTNGNIEITDGEFEMSVD
ncbi:MAG: hypothetical protein DI539_14995 [Flavobacterium psychrophilum]|nr:MAG: hypothetical protein DI539_14995 [Flavobacterium psychrophilum]